MRKIAVLCSGNGDSAYRLVSLFNEGNRIRVEAVITDRENNGVTDRFADTDAYAFFIDRDKWHESPEEILTILSERGVEMIALDDFRSVVPSLIEEEYAGRIITLTSVEEAPREVVAAFARLDETGVAVKTESATVDEGAGETEVTSQKGVDEEWADTLKINFDNQATRTTPPPVPGNSNTGINTPGNVPFPGDNQGIGAPARFGNMPPEGQYPQGEQYPQGVQYQQGEQYPQGRQYNENEQMPSTYLVWAIVMAIFCCTIPGIVAIVFSSQVASKYAVGDYEGARRASHNAEIWIIVSFVLGVISATIYVPMMMLS